MATHFDAISDAILWVVCNLDFHGRRHKNLIGGKSHNHPSGDPTPSRADIEMTRLVREALAALGIALHDHLVIGRKGHISFKSLALI